MEVLVDLKRMEEKEREALYVLKQDVSKWLNTVLRQRITPEDFLSSLDTGVVLCQLASRIQSAASTIASFKSTNKTTRAASAKKTPAASRGGAGRQDDQQQFNDTFKHVPMTELHCNPGASKGSFQARDNTANFIAWCRELGLKESLLFESEGLVLHRDEKRVILTLLAVARVGGDLGLATPKLVEMEKEIEREEKEVEVKKVVVSRGDNEILGILHQCTCPRQLKAVVPAPGKFHITMPSGRTMTVYIRVLNEQVMVRVGGGWDTLDHLLLKYDPCRMSKSTSISKDLLAKRAGASKRMSAHLEAPPKLAPMRVRQVSPSPRSVSKSLGQAAGMRKWGSTPSLYSRRRKVLP